jgi:hypothetical protein
MTFSRATQGILLMTLAMLSIGTVDGIAKYLSANYSPLFLGWVRYAVASAIVLPISALGHGRRVFPGERWTHTFCEAINALILRFRLSSKKGVWSHSGFCVGKFLKLALTHFGSFRHFATSTVSTQVILACR